MDDRKQRIIVDADGGEGISVFGWETADAAALEALAARLEANGVKVARGSRALADERFVRDLIVFSDPLGNRLEAFHGAETASDPFMPGRAMSGFRTGPLGLGHIVLNVETSETIQTAAAVLSRPARLPAHRLLLASVRGVLPARQSAPPLTRDDPHRQERRASHHDGSVLARRYGAGLRHRAARRPRRHHHGTPHVGLHHVVLHLHAVRLHGRVRLGRALDRSRHLAGL